MKNYSYVYWSVAIENSIVMICWAGLAIYFGKWWLALFAVCCMQNIKTKE